MKQLTPEQEQMLIDMVNEMNAEEDAKWRRPECETHTLNYYYDVDWEATRNQPESAGLIYETERSRRVAQCTVCNIYLAPHTYDLAKFDDVVWKENHVGCKYRERCNR